MDRIAVHIGDSSLTPLAGTTTATRQLYMSGNAVLTAARAIGSGGVDLMIAGGVESMSRAPFVVAKATSAFDRNAEMYDTTIGWRFVNPKMKARYGDDSMPATAENVAREWQVSREDQDAYALRSQSRAAKAQETGRFAVEIVPVAFDEAGNFWQAVCFAEHTEGNL